jgi:ATP-dependent RNA helicase MSS116
VTRDLFSSLPLSAPMLRAIQEKAGYKFLTVVQKETIPASLAGQDVLARARTGTGKTCAFLIPSIERLVATRAKAVAVLVVSPTRELASQIAEEAKKLVSFHQNIGVACLVGGSNINAEKRVLATGPHIVVATPGRLLDHLQTTPGFAAAVAKLQTLVRSCCFVSFAG